MNQSTKTRKELVLDFLSSRPNAWIDGPEIANQFVGGSEGLKRLRELRADGYDIRTRRHPNPERDIWQYMYVPKRDIVSPLRPDVPHQPKMLEQQPERIEFGQVITCHYCHYNAKLGFTVQRSEPKTPCRVCNGLGYRKP